MRSALTRIIAVLFVASLVLAGSSLTLAADDAAPNFTGNWTLNKKMSDNIQPPNPQGGQGKGQSQGKGGGGGGRGGGGRGGGGRGGGGSGSMGGSMGGSQQPSMKDQQQIMRLQKEMAHLEIFHDGVEINVTNGLDISRLLFTDGRIMNIWTQRGEANATAKWNGSTLEVTWKTRQDTKSRVRRYSISDDGLRLTLQVQRRMPQGDKFKEMTLVYDKTD